MMFFSAIPLILGMGLVLNSNLPRPASMPRINLMLELDALQEGESRWVEQSAVLVDPWGQCWLLRRALTYTEPRTDRVLVKMGKQSCEITIYQNMKWYAQPIECSVLPVTRINVR